MGAALISAGRILAASIIVVRIRIAGWTLGAAILAASIVVVRIRIAGFWRGGVEGWSFGLRVHCCLFDTVLLRGWSTRSLDLLCGQRTNVVGEALDQLLLRASGW